LTPKNFKGVFTANDELKNAACKASGCKESVQ
jgi:hypothetical protein